MGKRLVDEKFRMRYWYDGVKRQTRIVFITRDRLKIKKVWNFYTGENVMVAAGMALPEDFIMKIPRKLKDSEILEIIKILATIEDE